MSTTTEVRGTRRVAVRHVGAGRPAIEGAALARRPSAVGPVR